MTMTSRSSRPADRSCPRVLEVSTTGDPATSRIIEDPAVPGRGESVLRVHQFAMTSNNVSYVRAREQLGHGRAFPAAPGWMRVPVWGEATVVDGVGDGVPAGTRVIGYFPMAGSVAMSLEPRPDGTLVETSARRAHLAPVYQHYRVVDAPTDGLEFATLHIEALASALVPDLVGAGVDHVLISSAGSKTGQALAFLLAREGVACTGLTRDRSAVGQDGLTVFEYQELSSVAVPPGTVFLDLAGDPRLRARIVAQCGGAVAHTLALGGTRLTGRSRRSRKVRQLRRCAATAPAHAWPRWNANGARRRYGSCGTGPGTGFSRGLATSSSSVASMVSVRLPRSGRRSCGGSTGPERCASSRPSSVVSRGIAV